MAVAAAARDVNLHTEVAINNLQRRNTGRAGASRNIVTGPHWLSGHLRLTKQEPSGYSRRNTTRTILRLVIYYTLIGTGGTTSEKLVPAVVTFLLPSHHQN